MYKAGNGDCIAIESESAYILIDGGTARDYSNWSSNISSKSAIDAIIVTHIDNDHINGIIKLLQSENYKKIKSIYFNGVEQIFNIALSDQDEKLQTIKLNALSQQLSSINDREEIGFSEGTSLSYLIHENKINTPFNNTAIHSELGRKINVGNIDITIIGPSYSSLQDLKNNWISVLGEKRITPKILNKAYSKAFEHYINSLNSFSERIIEISHSEPKNIESLANTKFEDDQSLANKSSITFLAESNGKSILYLSDSDVSTILFWLDSQRLDKITVDAVKISHHGSKSNTSMALLNRIACRKYLISTNGKSHNHPDLETIARIAVANQQSGAEIITNYELNNIPTWFITELEANYRNIRLSLNSCKVYL